MGHYNSSFRSTIESLDSLYRLWERSRLALNWEPIFVLPPWLSSWWPVYGAQGIPYLYTAENAQGELIGLAPLIIKEKGAFFMGSEDVCDFLDFIIAPGEEEGFLSLFWEDITGRGVEFLSLGSVRPDSVVARHLISFAEKLHLEVSWETTDLSLEMDLPSSWEEYLGLLKGKQRHELRRKLRRLTEFAEVNYRVIEDVTKDGGVLDLFFTLFRQSRRDKNKFLSPEREAFFRTLAINMSRANLFCMGILELGGRPVASVMCFDHEGVVYLYNSGFDPQYSNLSVGLASKILCIKDSIEKGKRKFDFLKGPELYKYRLGGKEVPLRSCKIILR